MPLTFHLLAKPTGAVCNLDRAYYYFLSKEGLYHGSPSRRSDEVMRLYARDEAKAVAPW